MGFLEIRPEEIGGNVFERIGKGWMLLSVADGAGANTMTASWGGLGVLWGKPVAFVFVRPQRYTFTLTERESEWTLAFLGEEYREALRYCGSHSGRDGDKFAAAGLTPLRTGNLVYPAEAQLVLACRKLYAAPLERERFTDSSPLYTYAAGDFHCVYVCEITKVLEKENGTGQNHAVL